MKSSGTSEVAREIDETVLRFPTFSSSCTHEPLRLDTLRIAQEIFNARLYRSFSLILPPNVLPRLSNEA